MRTILTVLLILAGILGLLAQSPPTKMGTIIEGFEQLEKEHGIQIFYLKEYLSTTTQVPFPDTGKTPEEALAFLLAKTGLSILNYKNQVFIVAPKDKLALNFNQQYFTKKIQQQKDNQTITEELVEFEVGNSAQYDASQPIVVEGFISDDANKESLIGATILVEETNSGTVTNEIGKYELNLPTGEYTLVINNIGYVEKKIKIKVFSSANLDVTISKEAIQLDEVVVTDKANNDNVRSNEIGLEALSVEEIKKLPSFLGEADVMKSLLLLPGVSSVGEGSGGINVRGGTVDQNLIMQDGMYLFNSAHVLGLFSLFNSDVVKEVNLYKGSMPARYGGRLSSVLDVKLKEGSYKQFTGKGGIGLVSSRLTLETPIKKGESSILIGARASLSDYLFDVVSIAEIQESSAFFYDGNIKFSQRIKDKGKLTLAGYWSQDRFKFNTQFDFKWRTSGLNAGFRYLISDQLSFNIEGVFSEYTSQWDEPNTNRAFQLLNGIQYVKIRPEITYNLNALQTFNIGLESNLYRVNPGEIAPVTSTSTTIAEAVPAEKARDFAIYIDDEIELNDRLSLNLGLRYVIYQSLGAAEVDLYEPEAPKIISTITSSESFGNGDVIKTYTGIEPRASLRFSLDEATSVKMSFNRTQQFINQISNTTAVSPVDIWQLSNYHIEPVRANNYSIGYFKNLEDNIWETSFELFYRDIDNLIEFKDLANLLVNNHLETALISGEGRSYGAELSIKKTTGRMTGRLGYTYSRSERKTNSQFLEESINNNNWFLANFDRPHDLNLVFTYQVNKKNHLAINFVYASGRPITAPIGSFSTDNIFNIPIYSDRNTFRIPAYHRLDISYTIGQSLRKSQKWRSSWTFSIFNVYARRNPFSVFFTQNAFQNPQANRLSVLGSMIPSINYNFSF